MILTYAHSCNELDCKFRNFTLNEKWFQKVPSKGQRYHSSGCRARKKKIFRLTTEKKKIASSLNFFYLEVILFSIWNILNREVCDFQNSIFD